MAKLMQLLVCPSWPQVLTVVTVAEIALVEMCHWAMIPVLESAGKRLNVNERAAAERAYSLCVFDTK